MPKILKYKLAYSNQHNCTNSNGHAFALIQDEVKKKAIREERPYMQSALWQCVNKGCKKIMASM